MQIKRKHFFLNQFIEDDLFLPIKNICESLVRLVLDTELSCGNLPLGSAAAGAAASAPNPTPSKLSRGVVIDAY